VARHLDAQQRRRAEAVEAEPPARLDAGDAQGPIADDSATQQGSGVQSANPSGIRTATSARTTIASAKPPSRSQPVKAAASHRFSRSLRQKRHVPSVPKSQ